MSLAELVLKDSAAQHFVIMTQTWTTIQQKNQEKELDQRLRLRPAVVTAEST